MNASELIKENNQVREQLSSENKAFYEDLLIVVRAKSLFRKETVYEETLLAILQDLLEAQAAGQTAEHYLGRNIYTLADEIVSETPRENKLRMLKFVLSCWVIYLFFSNVPSLPLQLIFSAQHTATISLPNLLLGSLYTIFLIWGFLSILSANRWILSVKNKSFFWLWIRAFLPAIIIFLGYILIFWLTKGIGTITF